MTQTDAGSFTSGPNEHHIPRFLQRSFGIGPRGKRPKDIFVYSRHGEPEQRAISETASEDYFYGKTLDEKLKIPENNLGLHFSQLRKQAAGAAVDPGIAADLVTHLAPRSKHLRTSMAVGLHKLVAGAHDLFADPSNLTAMLGLDQSEPGTLFHERLSEGLRVNPDINAVGLPWPVIERVAFYMAREQIEPTVESITAVFGRMLSQWIGNATNTVRDGHNRALEKLSEGANPRRDRLTTFEWSIERGPAEGAILPDCVALGVSHDEPVLPMMFLGEEIYGVVMPLSTETLLVGRCPDSDPFELESFNEDAAACSEEFFLAQTDAPTLRSLCDRIGTRSSAYFEGAIREAVSANLPEKTQKLDDRPNVDHAEPDQTTAGSFGYSIRCLDFGDEAVTQRLADAISPVVAHVSNILPLWRLDGITSASDYGRALRSVTSGEELSATETSEDRDVGAAGRVVQVVREGEAKGHVVLSILAADFLLRDDERLVGLGLQILVHQLVLVAMMELTERALPGALLTPIITDHYQAGLYANVADAVNGYVAAHVSGGVGEGAELAAFYRSSLIDVLERMKAVSEEERSKFPEHHNVDIISAAVTPLVSSALYYAAVLIGHCEGSDEPILDSEGELASILQTLGLAYWLADYGKALEAFRQRLGRWRSVDEFLVFNRHVERLLWSVHLFPWESPEGPRLELLIPLKPTP